MSPIKALFLLLTIAPLNCLALSTDKDQPVEIFADSADIDQSTGITTYLGSVKITQGSMELLADKVVIENKENKPDKLTATGQPAKFKQLPDNEKVYVHGIGNTMVYQIHDEELILTDKAELHQGGNKFTSDRIVYDRIKARLKAGAAAQGKERVHVTLQPEAMQGKEPSKK